jgi:hypothetical protein
MVGGGPRRRLVLTLTFFDSGVGAGWGLGVKKRNAFWGAGMLHSGCLKEMPTKYLQRAIIWNLPNDGIAHFYSLCQRPPL